MIVTLGREVSIIVAFVTGLGNIRKSSGICTAPLPIDFGLIKDTIS